MFLTRWLRTSNERPRNQSRSTHFKPRCEALENRQLLAANLWVTDAYMVDQSGNQVDKPAVGQVVHLQTEFKTDDLLPGANYKISFSIDSEVKTTGTLTWGAGASGVGSWMAKWGDWVVKPGSHTVRVELDATGTVAETSGLDNIKTFSFIPKTFVSEWGETKFVAPLAGTPHVNWQIGGFVDLDSFGGTRDYLGNTGAGAKTYNGHDALDIGIVGGFDSMKVGLPVLASASGYVTIRHDGEEDLTGPPNGTEPMNQVIIDHGNGWMTYYGHLRKGSVAVSEGDFVKAGQPIGLLGNSGNSGGPHLHWGVYANYEIDPVTGAGEPWTGAAVETYVAPSSYWLSPAMHSVPSSGPTANYAKNHISEGGSGVNIVVYNPLLGFGGQYKYTTQGVSATATSDYTPTVGTLSFGPLEFFKVVNVPIVDDTRHEATEKFLFKVTRMNGSLLSSREYSILDNDALLNFDSDTGTLRIDSDTDAVGEVVKLDVVGENIKVTVGAEIALFPKTDVNAIKINGSMHDDKIYIYATPAGVKTTVDAGGGNDTIDVGKVGAFVFSLDSIDGELIIDGDVGSDKLYLRDTASAATTYSLNGNALSRPGAAKMSFTSTETVEITAGGGNDWLWLGAAAAPAGVMFKGGGGSDSIQGANVATTWTVDAVNAGFVSHGGVRFNGVENLAGGSAADTFAFKNSGSLAGKLEGLAGVDTLDYSARTSAVTVNLVTGKATGVTGLISSISDVIGGSGNDILTGDQWDNLLDGGGGIDNLSGNGGADILIGGGNNDVLSGGDGRDILLGGLGFDIMAGGSGEDLLVDGNTAFVNKYDMLKASRDKWNDAMLAYADRVNLLRNTGVVVDAVTYKWNASSILPDIYSDQMLGGLDLDWFWAKPKAPNFDTTDALATETLN